MSAFLKVSLKLKLLPHFKGELPKYETLHASGMDVRAAIDSPIELACGGRVAVPTGLSMQIPPGYEIQVRPRSGLAAKNGITVVNAPGTVDADYRGEVKILLVNLGAEKFVIQPGDRVAQFVLCPVVQAELEIVDELETTIRGEGGFGSTGVSEVRA